jgi:hypothetical protein
VIWVSWRRQRSETLIAAGMLVLLAALLVPTGLEMARAYDHDGLSSCLAPTTSEACAEAISSFTSRFDSVSSLIAWLTLVPGLIGVLLAAPFVLEFEHGTNRLAWTQSVSRTRWIATKLGLAVAAGLAAALVFTLLITWWRTPLVHLEGRMDQSVFDSEGIVVIGYTLFALGLATAVGVLWRRAVPALVVGFVGYFAVRLFVDTWLRQRLLSPLRLTWPLKGNEPAVLQHAWVLERFPSDASGHPVMLKLGGVCAPLAPTKSGVAECLARHGYVMHAVYQPASRFWALQGIEASMFVGAALVLLTFAAWWTYRRAA